MNGRWFLVLPAALGGFLLVLLVNARVLERASWRGPELIVFTAILSAVAAMVWVGLGTVVAPEKRGRTAVALAGALIVVDLWQALTLPHTLSAERRGNVLVALGTQAVVAVLSAGLVHLLQRSGGHARRA